MQMLSVHDLAEWLAAPDRPRPLLLDVREAWEVEICALDGITHMPMATVPDKLDALDLDAPIVCICHHGVRSMHVAAFLESRGFSALWNLTGGVDAWAREVDLAMAVY